MKITERLANLSVIEVLVTIVVLLVLRWILLKQRTPVAKSIAEIAESLAVALGLVFLLIRPFVIQAFFIPSASMHPTLLEDDRIMVNKFIYRFKEPERGDIIVFKSPPKAQKDEAEFIKRVIAVPGDTVRITPGYVMVGEHQYDHEWLRSKFARGGHFDPSAKVKLVGDKVMVNGVEVSKADIAAAANEPDAQVKVVPGKVYLNGKPIKEPYIAEDPDTPYPTGAVPDEWKVVDKKGNPLVKIPEGRLLVMGDNRNNSSDARVWGLLERKRVLGEAMFIFWPLDRIEWIN